MWFWLEVEAEAGTLPTKLANTVSVLWAKQLWVCRTGSWKELPLWGPEPFPRGASRATENCFLVLDDLAGAR